MSSMNIWHWLITLAVVVMVFRTNRLNWRNTRRRDLERIPLYSAETTAGAEAEFTGEKLPKRIPMIVIAILVAVVIAALLWIL